MQRFYAVVDAADMYSVDGPEAAAASSSSSSSSGSSGSGGGSSGSGGGGSGSGGGGGRVTADIGFSQNVPLARLPFTDPGAHHANVVAGLVRGTCLWLDFPFPAFPQNLGHWAEALAPVYSALADGGWRARAPEADGRLQALVFPNLHRDQVQVRAQRPAGTRACRRGCCGGSAWAGAPPPPNLLPAGCRCRHLHPRLHSDTPTHPRTCPPPRACSG